MNEPDRRRYRRHETEIDITIHNDDEKIPATIIDVSEGGIESIAKKEVFPGSRVHITFNYIGDFAIDGTVKWVRPEAEEESTQYRIGIEADRLLIKSEDGLTIFPARAEFVERLVSGPEK